MLKYLLLCSAVLLQAFQGTAMAAESSEDSFKVRICSYNIEFFRSTNAKQIAEALLPMEFDIIALQEIPNTEGYDSTEDVCNALNELEQKRNSDRQWHFICGTIDSGKRHGTKYKSILSRAPLTDFAELDLHNTSWVGGSATKATTIIDGKKVSVYSLHVPGVPGNKKNLVEHEILKADDADLFLIAGDFNETLFKEGHQIMKQGGYESTWEMLKFDVTKHKTWNTFKDDVNAGVIDHIYLRPEGFEVVEGDVLKLDPLLSDHHPVWAEIRAIKK